jgi:hypothetical protein
MTLRRLKLKRAGWAHQEVVEALDLSKVAVSATRLEDRSHIQRDQIRLATDCFIFVVHYTWPLGMSAIQLGLVYLGRISYY